MSTPGYIFTIIIKGEYKGRVEGGREGGGREGGREHACAYYNAANAK